MQLLLITTHLVGLIWEMWVHTNGSNGNGHHANGIGPSVELVLGNGHAPAPVNGNGKGHHDKDPEPQQSLFSWAEFMAEEPVGVNRQDLWASRRQGH